jgi:MFS family permease
LDLMGRWAVLGLVALGTFMTTLDASIVNISLPSIARTFHTPITGAVECSRSAPASDPRSVG